MRYPMFSEHQVVIIKEANQLRDLDKLESYFEHIVPTTILVIAYRTAPMTSAERSISSSARRA